MVPLEVEINGHKETLEVAVTDLNRTDMFLGHNWLVKHNPEVNWKNGTIKFTRCPGNCTMTHKDIQFNSRWTKETVTDKTEQDNSEIGKEFDLSPIYSTRRSLKNYQSEENGTTKST